jgi:hypothetical protein
LQESLTAGAALPAGAIIDYFLADADYTAEGSLAIPSGKTTRLVSMCGGTTVGDATVSAEDPATGFSLLDVLIPAGVAITGVVGGNVLLELFYAEPEGNGIGNLVETLPAGQLQIKATNGAITSIVAPNCNLIQSSGTNYPNGINAPNCDFNATDGNVFEDVSVFTYSCVDCVIGGDAEAGVQWTVVAVSTGSVKGFNSCQFNGFGDFNGPVGSFTTDIDSAYSARAQAWSLSGGATTVFNANIGQVLTVNSNGFPVFSAPAVKGFTLASGGALFGATGTIPAFDIRQGTSFPIAVVGDDIDKVEFWNFPARAYTLGTDVTFDVFWYADAVVGNVNFEGALGAQSLADTNDIETKALAAPVSVEQAVNANTRALNRTRIVFTGASLDGLDTNDFVALRLARRAAAGAEMAGNPRFIYGIVDWP